MRIVDTAQLQCLQKSKIEEIKRNEWSKYMEENAAESTDEFDHANYESTQFV